MLQSTTLDAHTVVVRADVESDMQDLFTFLKQAEESGKRKLLTRFLNFAEDNYVTDPSFKFNRAELYDRENIC